ncbi:MAG: type II CAAX endopeptidase family protein [Woeseiaceae bacterium]|nr:type II CAAX endopeptidase family protein [Woeseiaceae bacterium]
MIAARTIRVSILAILLFQVAALIAREFLRLRLGAIGIGGGSAKDLSYLVVPVVLGTLMWPILKQQSAHLRHVLRRDALTWRIVACGVLAGALLQATWWTQAAVLRGVSAAPVRLDCTDAWQLFLGLVVMVLITPLIEEVINRGLLTSALLHFGTWPAVLVSSILFAVMHSPTGAAFAFFAGLILALQYLHTGAVWLSLVTHLTYNGLVQLGRFCIA